MNTIIGFDLDGTLYDDYQIIKLGFDKVSRYLSQIVFDKSEIIYQKLFDYFKIDRRYVFNRLFEEYKIFDIGININLLNKCIDIYRNIDIKLELFNWVESLLQLLITHKIKIGIITNGNKAFQLRKIEALNLYKYFEPRNIYINYKERHLKPNIITYERLFDKKYNIFDLIGKKNNYYYIGNDCKIDFLGANKLNINTICLLENAVNLQNTNKKELPKHFLFGKDLKDFLRKELKL